MTGLADALAGVTKIGFDTSPFIYFVERHPSYLDLVREVLHQVDAGTLTAYSSVITLTEVLTQPICAGNLTLAEEYRKRLTNSRNLILKPISPMTAEDEEARAVGERAEDRFNFSCSIATRRI